MEHRWSAHQDFAIFGNANFQVRQSLAHRPDAVVDRRIHRDDRRSFGETVTLMNADADRGVPLGELAPQRRAAGNESLDPPAHALSNFREDERVRQFPTRCSGNFSGKNFWLVLSPHRECPTENHAFRSAFGFLCRLGINFLVHTRNRNENRRLHFEETRRQPVQERAICQGYAVIQQGEIHVARRDVAERQKRNADEARPHVKPNQRTHDVGRDVAVGQHRAFGSAGRSRGVDDRGQVIRSDGARPAFDLRAELIRPLRHDLLEGDALACESSDVAIELERIHDHDSFDLSLGQNRQDLVQLLVGGQKNRPAARIVQNECGLFRGQCGVERNGHGPEQQAGDIRHGPLGSILAQNSDAIPLANPTRIERACDLGNPLAKLAGGHGQPLAGLAIQHHAIQIAVDRCEENVVQSCDAHSVVQVPIPWVWFRQPAPN